MSSESLTLTLAVGLTAGWLAGQIVHGTGYGIINDLIIGVVGSFIGGWLLPQLGVHLGAGIIAASSTPLSAQCCSFWLYDSFAVEAAGTAAGVDDGVGIVSATIAVRTGRARPRILEVSVRAARQQ